MSRPLSLREKIREQQRLNGTSENTPITPQAPHSTVENGRMTRKEMYEQRMREQQQASIVPTLGQSTASSSISFVESLTESYSSLPSLASPETSLPSTARPATSTATASKASKEMDERSEARRAYLAEAKARNDATQREFEDRVKDYFGKALEMERIKAENLALGQGPKKSNKEANHEAVEQGLFLQQLKKIGLDVGTMSKTVGAFKTGGVSGAGGARPTSASFDSSFDARPQASTVSTSASWERQESRPAFSYTAPATGHTSAPYSAPHSAPHSAPSWGADDGSRLSAVEASLSALQRQVSEQDKKLDLVLDLQRQILRLMSESRGESDKGSISEQPQPEPQSSRMTGRRRYG